MSHTYAVLEISKSAWDEIAGKLKEAGYQHAFHEGDEGTLIDMHGIALQAACEHEWESKTQPGTVHGPTEYFVVCKHCGAEKAD